MYEYTLIDTIQVTRIIKRKDEMYYKSAERIAEDAMDYRQDIGADKVEIKDRLVFVREEENESAE